jgi:hypothetical protein
MPEFTPPFSEFWKFIRAVFRKPIFPVFLVQVIAAVILQMILPEFSLAPVYYLGIVFVGFIWSAFQAYRDVSLAYQKALAPIPVEKKPGSELSISFVQGSEYAYSISDPYSGQNIQMAKMQNDKKLECHFDGRGVFFVNGEVYYVMAKGSLDINLWIQNSGDLPLDVLSVHLDNDLNLNHLRLFFDGVYHQGSHLRVPLRLDNGGIVGLQSKYMISLGRNTNNGLFAADFQSLPRSILHEISVDTKDMEGKRRTHTAEIRIPSKPLADLFANQWRYYNQEEYLVLAGYGLTDNM